MKLLIDLPEQAHETLLREGYLRWKVQSLGTGRREALYAFLRALLQLAPNRPQGPLNDGEIAKRFADGDVGFYVVQLPEAEPQAIVWYLLVEREGVVVPMTIPLCGASLEMSKALIDPDVRSQITQIRERPYTDIEWDGAASDEMIQTASRVLEDIRSTKTDEQFSELYREQAPALYGLPPDLSRSVAELAASLPDESLQTLWRDGYLKWRFNMLDRRRKDMIKRIQLGSFAGWTGDDQRMREIAERMQEVLPKMMETADTGFVVLEPADSTRQALAWYVVMPQVEAPTMLPILGKASPNDESVKVQLLQLKTKSYSSVDPLLPDAQSTTQP
jgi:hypothetical protein